MADSSDFIVLVVDDTEANIDILVELLGDTYDVRVALDGETALESVVIEKPDLILLDILMPEMNGYEVCRRLKSTSESRDIPVVFLTAMSDEKDEAKGLQLGAVDYITKPFSPELVKARVANHLDLKRYRDHLEELVTERTKQLELTQEVTVYCLASLVETRDPETGRHILRTQRYVRELAGKLRELGYYRDELTRENINLLYMSAPLHDIGKVGVEDRILMKPGPLTDVEFNEMKKHTTLGRDTLQVAEEKLGHNSFLHYARDIAYSHHEKWDGTGYPEGTSGQDIPVSGRLMAIADVYDALISKRVYKPLLSHNKAVSIMKEGKGSHFDPVMIDAFLCIEDRFRKIAIKYADSSEEREMLLM